MNSPKSKFKNNNTYNRNSLERDTSLSYTLNEPDNVKSTKNKWSRKILFWGMIVLEIILALNFLDINGVAIAVAIAVIGGGSKVYNNSSSNKYNIHNGVYKGNMMHHFIQNRRVNPIMNILGNNVEKGYNYSKFLNVKRYNSPGLFIPIANLSKNIFQIINRDNAMNGHNSIERNMESNNTLHKKQLVSPHIEKIRQRNFNKQEGYKSQKNINNARNKREF